MAATLKVIGDPWTLLIIREAFAGVRRFEHWQSGLGVARNVLAARLKTLTAHGVMERRTYSDRPVRYEYLLTAKGRALFPILAAMRKWGDQHVYGPGREPQLFTHACGGRFEPRSVCACCGRDVEDCDVEPVRLERGLTVGQVLDQTEA